MWSNSPRSCRQHRTGNRRHRTAIRSPHLSTTHTNTAERNHYHYRIKYHRDDAFLLRNIINRDTRRRLDQAWIDLLTSFEYHDAYLRFVVEKYNLDLAGTSIADLNETQIDALPAEPRAIVGRLRDEFVSMREAREAAEPGHVDDVVRFADRAWRRGLTEHEQRRLRTFYASLRGEGLGHTASVRALLARVLVAPDFLYRVESPSTGPEIVGLSAAALGSRLSYFIWSSPPDEELRRAAETGQLQSDAEIARQARRMLRDPKARRLASEFFGQWLGFYRFVQYRGVDTTRFPEFTEDLKAAMHEEAVAFFTHVVPCGPAGRRHSLCRLHVSPITNLHDTMASPRVSPQRTN